MELKEMVCRTHMLNKAIHGALEEAVSLCGAMSELDVEALDIKDMQNFLDEILDIADNCKHFAASVALAMLDFKKDGDEEDV